MRAHRLFPPPPARRAGEPPADQRAKNRLLILGYEPLAVIDDLGEIQAMLLAEQIERATRIREERSSRIFWATAAVAAVGATALAIYCAGPWMIVGAGLVAAFCTVLFATSWMLPP